MKNSLADSLHTLCTTPLQLGGNLTAAMLLRLGEMCLSLFTALGQLVHQEHDPRLSLAYAQLVEKFSRRIHHEQLAAALDLEISGAHALESQTYDKIRSGDQEFVGVADRVAGKPCFRSTADLLASWMKINYFAAAARISDAHLVVGRCTAQGTAAPPRMPHMAALFAANSVDDRQLLDTARKLAALEPKDQIFQGTDTQLTARDDDGELLEQCFARLLENQGPNAAKKQINQKLRSYKDKHSQQLAPEQGLFVGPVKQDVHEFKLRTNAVQAQLLHSLIAQAASRRTEAGRNAASPEQGGSQQTPVPDWLIADSPIPDWAGDGQVAEGIPDAEQFSNSRTDAEPEQEPSPAMRKLNALMAKLAVGAPGGEAKTITPKVVVYLWLKDLQDLARAHGASADSVRIPPGQLRRILAHANIIPIVLGGNCQPVDVGRARRFHDGAIRLAVMARDRGCIVPDCTTSPELVEIDHYKRAWADGGTTSVDSGTAVCTDGHHARHLGQIKIVDVHGLPHVILPPHLDPDQKPRRNTYWGALQLDDAPGFIDTQQDAEDFDDSSPPGT